MNILVTGGAGYIGSHVAKNLKQNGFNPIIYDNLSTGHEKVAQILDIPLIYGDIRDKTLLEQTLRNNKIDVVIHLAALSIVFQSMSDPISYYNNNVYGTMCLLESMKGTGVNKIVFSSTAAVYGEPGTMPIDETCKTEPSNVYGETKLSIERMLHWFDLAYGIKHVIFRYFNAAGADKESKIGEMHTPETHLIPIILNAAKTGATINIFGDDYDTPDGTCIRDYLHVSDIAEAHLLAVKKLSEKNVKSEIYNLGSEHGYSVKQIIDTSEKITNLTLNKKISLRRKGDPEVLIASSKKAQKELGWTMEYTDISEIIETAWKFIERNF